MPHQAHIVRFVPCRHVAARRVLVFSFALLFAAGPVQAQDGAGSGAPPVSDRAGPDEEINAGIRLYNDLEYEAARAKLEGAMNREGASRSEIARAALFLGLVHLHLGETAIGETYFAVALSYDDSLAIPGTVSPKLKNVFQTVAERMAFPRPFAYGAAELPPDPGPAPPQATVRAKAAHRGWGAWTAIAASTTVAAGGAATTFALMARSTKTQIEGSPHGRAELAELQDQLSFRANAANLAFAATGALLLGTLAVYKAETRQRARGKQPADRVGPPPALSARPLAGGAWVSAGVRF
jgi:hypothetical protein